LNGARLIPKDEVRAKLASLQPRASPVAPTFPIRSLRGRRYGCKPPACSLYIFRMMGGGGAPSLVGPLRHDLARRDPACAVAAMWLAKRVLRVSLADLPSSAERRALLMRNREANPREVVSLIRRTFRLGGRPPPGVGAAGRMRPAFRTRPKASGRAVFLGCRHVPRTVNKKPRSLSG
jgi:hypothetical protein